MKNLLYIPVICMLLLLLPACASVKKTEQHQTVTKDTLVQQAAQRTTDSFVQKIEKTVRDTVVRIAYRTVRDTVKLPADPRGRYYEKYGNGIKAWARVLDDGSLAYGCNADSLLLVIPGLVHEREYISHRYDSLAAVYEQKVHTVQQTDIRKTVKTKSLFGYLWPYLLAAVIIAGLVLLYKILAKQYL